jgi:hypothetical protein
MKYHIIRISADVNNITDETREKYVRPRYKECLRVLDSLGTRIGDVPLGGGLFLVSHESILQFLACSPTDPAEIQIKIFSLHGTEDQLVPQGAFQDLGSMERYRIPKYRVD